MKKTLLLLAVAGAFLAAAGYWIAPGASSGQAVLYEQRAVEFGPLVETISATGKLTPREISVVSSPVPGQVVKIYDNADFNRYVEANEPLLLLDPSQAKVKVEQARAALEAARIDVLRARAQRDAAKISLTYQQDLLDKEVGQKAKVEEAKYLLAAASAAVEAAESKQVLADAVLREARLGLDKTVVRAPAAGIIIDRTVHLGQMVGPQMETTLFKVATDLSQMEVQTQIAEGDFGKVHVGQSAVFTVDAYSEGNVRFEGRVKQVHSLPNSFHGAVFYNTVIQVANRRAPPTRESWMRVGNVLTVSPLGPTSALPYLYLRPDDPWMLQAGMTATVDVIRRRHADVWKLPVEALGLQLDDYYQTPAARAKLEEWKARGNDDWKHVWVLDPAGTHNKPWPIFVRINGVNASGEAGIKDSQYIEVLEWEPEAGAKIDPRNPATFPRVIISAPPASKPSIFDRPTRIMS